MQTYGRINEVAKSPRFEQQVTHNFRPGTYLTPHMPHMESLDDKAVKLELINV